MSTTDLRSPLEASGPRGYPLIGLIPLLRKDPLNIFLSTAIEYGDVARLDSGTRAEYPKPGVLMRLEARG